MITSILAAFGVVAIVVVVVAILAHVVVNDMGNRGDLP